MTEPDERAPDARFTLANERTLLAYQRSAIGLMAAAIAVAHFFGDEVMVLVLALAMLGTGAFAAVGGYAQLPPGRRRAPQGPHRSRAVPRPTWSAWPCCSACSSPASTSSRRPPDSCQILRR